MIKDKLKSLELLRGIAVLAVCFGHFGNALSAGPHFSSIFHLFHEYGKYGVQMFFVISGFIIPFSLFKAEYSMEFYGLFLLKRLARLHPPYLVALTASLIIGYVSYKARLVPFPETFQSIVLSTLYGHVSEINPVFWTLAVEAQFYLFIGLVYAWLIRYPRASLYLVMPFLLLLSKSLIADYVGLISFISYFLLGWMTFLIYTKRGELLTNSLGLVGIAIFSLIADGYPAAVAAIFTVSVILFYSSLSLRAFSLPGRISYSLYLIHFPIGIKFINLASRFLDPNIRWVLFPLALAATCGIAWVFWKYIESPCAEYSSALKYREVS